MSTALTLTMLSMSAKAEEVSATSDSDIQFPDVKDSYLKQVHVTNTAQLQIYLQG